MTHYSENPGHVRADFFKPDTGKWYMTEVLDMTPTEQTIPVTGAAYQALDAYESPFTADRVRAAVVRSGRDPEQWIIVVVEPFAFNAVPVTLLPKANRAAMGVSW